MFYVAWSNPNSTETVAKDGIYATTGCTLTAGAAILTDQPALVCAWDTKDTSGTPLVTYDIHPIANYDSANSVFDTANTGADDVTPDATDTQICTELWKITDTAIACVEMGGSVDRDFSTGDTTDDFILDYVEY